LFLFQVFVVFVVFQVVFVSTSPLEVPAHTRVFI
jgi:hypothetical protein